ncbi:MAG TPA: fructosamine kinase family protein [Rhizomicrobium sp.]
MNALAEAGAALIGGVLRRSEALAGGSLSQIARIELTDGRDAIVKNGPAPRIEAAMLQAIAASAAPAPAVLGVSDEVLVLERLPAGGALHHAWPSLGTALATLHQAKGERYGWPENYAFASVEIENGWADDWPRFWAERRLLVHVAHLPPSLARRLEALAADLPNRLPARPKPSLLHGDMWGGNVLVAENRVSGLIDPACIYGHGEVDLAMLTLFDGPSAAFYDAYGPLQPGHEERLAIYQLWPALVHLRLFGSGYRGMVERFLADAGV